MRNWTLLLALILSTSALAQVDHSDSTTTPSTSKKLKINPGVTLFGELLGKGFHSFNLGFPIKGNHRLSIGLTALDYEVADYEDYSVGPGGAYTPGIMYYYLNGKGPHYLELGAGVSVFHRWDVDLVNDSPVSLHGVAGYRYQKSGALLFRIGFTPFKRINNFFLPLFGASLGITL